MYLGLELPWCANQALGSHEATVIMVHRADVHSVIWTMSRRGASYPSMNHRIWQLPELNATSMCLVRRRGQLADQRDTGSGRHSVPHCYTHWLMPDYQTGFVQRSPAVKPVLRVLFQVRPISNLI